MSHFHSVAFANTVGVAPGTTTMQLGGLGCGGRANPCPPDEMQSYVNPPVVSYGPPSGVSVEAATADPTLWDPYADPTRLNGLGDAGDEASNTGTSPRWGLILASAVIVFGATLGIAHFTRR